MTKKINIVKRGRMQIIKTRIEFSDACSMNAEPSLKAMRYIPY